MNQYPMNTTGYQPARVQNPWRPGAFARMPWLPLAGLIVSVIGLGASAVILVYSDGKPISDWAFQPPTYLAISTVITNICLFYVFKEGANVAWWHTAGKSTTIADLHRHWLYGSSFQDAVLSGKHINYVAIACIIATIAQINSPLLQRASKAVVEPIVGQVPVSMKLLTAIPSDFASGYVSGRGYEVPLYTQKFSEVVQAWNNNATITIPSTGCTGTCTTEIEGLGLGVTCNSYTVPYDLIAQTFSNGSVDTTPGSAVSGIDAFETHFSWSVAAPSNLSLSIAYKPTPACTGDLLIQNCTLQISTVRYAVLLSNTSDASTVSLNPHTSLFDDKVLQIHNLPLYPHQGPTSFGGYWRALQNKFGSSSHLRFVGALGYESRSVGNLATQYAVVNASSSSSSTGSIGTTCDLSFRDPLAEMLAGARSLLFRTALAFADEVTAVQSVVATQSGERAVFRTSYGYLVGGVGVTALALCVAVGLFRGYAALGRGVTMSPVEVGKAFDAPLMRGVDGNAEIKGLVRGVGGTAVRYGVVGGDGLGEEVIIHEPGEYQAMGGKGAYVRANDVSMQFLPTEGQGRLIMGPAERVRPPRRGEVFDS